MFTESMVDLTWLHPFNSLRNVARLQARTPLVLMLDADFPISDTFSTWMEDTQHSRGLLELLHGK